jgi:hypothetical protein
MVGRWLVGVGLLIAGARHAPDASGHPWKGMIPWAWLDANWIALACFAGAAVLFSYSPIKWWVDRQNSKDARKRIRSAPTLGSFHDTDAAEVLRYLREDTVWAWKTYADLNYWQFVEAIHLAEFQRAAKAGEIVTTGYASKENGVVVIDRRYWVDGRVQEETANKPYGVTMSIGVDSLRRMTWAQIGVATADMKATWPPASFPRRVWSSLRVWLKKVWYATRLSDWLDRRRRSKQETVQD